MNGQLSASNSVFSDPGIVIAIMLALLVLSILLFILSISAGKKKSEKQLSEKAKENDLLQQEMKKAEKESAMYAKIVNESGASIYVCSDSTFELLYMSEHMKEMFPETGQDYRGRKCYEYLMGRYTPCTFCKVAQLKEDSLMERECRDEEKKTDYIFKGKRIVWEGVPAIINYVTDNTAHFRERQKQEENYHNQITLMSDVSPQAVGTYRVNLTKNTFTEAFGLPSDHFNIEMSQSADDFFEFAYEHCATREDEEAFSAVFNRGKLLQSFNEGVTKLSVDHGYYMNTDAPTWITSAISMAQNPQNGDVEAIIYTVDIRRQKVMESLLRTVADSDYDYISILDLADGSYQEVFGKNLPSSVREAVRKDYREVMEQNIREHGADIDPEDTIEKMQLPRVRQELASNRRYNVYYMEYDRAGNRRNKMCSFQYLDRTRNLVCFTGSDVTEEYENNLRAKMRYDAAIEASKRLINAPMQVLTSMKEYDFEGRKILLVEDHPLNYRIAENLLIKTGCRVVGAENGEEAIREFERSKGGFDLILMDIRMPVMDGLNATRRIRASENADASTIPIIAMTANAFEDDIHKSLCAGMNGHLAKPINPKQLYETLAKYLK